MAGHLPGPVHCTASGRPRVNCLDFLWQAIWLEPQFTVTNLTGIPLQIAQLNQPPAQGHLRKRNILRGHSPASRQARDSLRCRPAARSCCPFPSRMLPSTKLSEALCWTRCSAHSILVLCASFVRTFVLPFCEESAGRRGKSLLRTRCSCAQATSAGGSSRPLMERAASASAPSSSQSSAQSLQRVSAGSLDLSTRQPLPPGAR